MNRVINLKKENITFKRKSLEVVVPLDPTEGVHYTKPICNYVESDDDLDQIYKIIVHDEDWINPTADGRIAWERDKSCASYLDEEIENL